MRQSNNPTEGNLSGDWIAEHIDDVDAQISLIQSVLDAGETRLAIDIRNYLSLHRYLRGVLENYRAAEQRAIEYRQMWLAQAVRNWKRPRGRPRKTSSGLLAGLRVPAPPKNPIGRPRKHPGNFFQELNELVESVVSDSRRLGKLLNIKAALTRVIDETLQSDLASI